MATFGMVLVSYNPQDGCSVLFIVVLILFYVVLIYRTCQNQSDNPQVACAAIYSATVCQSTSESSRKVGTLHGGETPRARARLPAVSHVSAVDSRGLPPRRRGRPCGGAQEPQGIGPWSEKSTPLRRMEQRPIDGTVPPFLGFEETSKEARVSGAGTKGTGVPRSTEPQRPEGSTDRPPDRPRSAERLTRKRKFFHAGPRRDHGKVRNPLKNPWKVLGGLKPPAPKSCRRFQFPKVKGFCMVVVKVGDSCRNTSHCLTQV